MFDVDSDTNNLSGGDMSWKGLPRLTNTPTFTSSVPQNTEVSRKLSQVSRSTDMSDMYVTLPTYEYNNSILHSLQGSESESNNTTLS